jgi:hypothetical protein
MQNHPDPFDELAAMFLTAPRPQPPQTAAAASEPARSRAAAAPVSSGQALPRLNAMTELLIVGNMPVRAGLWLTPYADALARQIGSIGLLRLDGHEPSLQVVRGHESLATANLRAPLAQTIHDLAGFIDLWMLRGPEQLSAEEALDVNADRITILSSADEAAVVAAYQMVKDLAGAAEQSARTLPLVGLAIVGADQHAASTVIDRLNRTTVSFLGVEVRLVALLPRIDAGIRCTRHMTFAGEATPSVIEARQWIEQARAKPAMTPVEPALAAAPPPSSSRPLAKPPQPSFTTSPDVIGRIDAPADVFVHDARRILRQPAEPAFDERPPPAASAAPPPTAASQDGPGHSHILENVRMSCSSHAHAPAAPDERRQCVSQPSAAGNANDAATPPDLAAFIAPPAVKLPPKVVIELEHKPPGHVASEGSRPAIEPDDHGRPMPLAKFVAGLSPLPVRAPGHERIEIAVDNAGVLHLLARDNLLRELPVVERWAHAHRELIAMACPQHRIDQAGRTLCHVFASEPLKVADLHSSNLRLHVLAAVSVGEKTAWYSAPLNVVSA